MLRTLYRHASVALLFAGSAILLYSCGAQAGEESAERDETMMTEYSENLTVVESQNGRKSYDFTTPLLEGYKMAKDPYREFRKGVHIVTYKDDSLSSVDATLTANYAIHYTARDLWEAKGNVVAETAGGERTLYTQQLFWNAKTRRIYSNVDSKIVQNGGKDVFYGEGFESDDAMKDWRFRRMTGRMEFEMRNRADSIANSDSTSRGRAPAPLSERPKPPAAKAADSIPESKKGAAASFSSHEMKPAATKWKTSAKEGAPVRTPQSGKSDNRL